MCPLVPQGDFANVGPPFESFEEVLLVTLIDFITCRSVRARPSLTPGGGG